LVCCVACEGQALNLVEDINQRQQHEDNDNDDPIQSPRIRPRPQRRRPPCDTNSHK